MSEPSDLSWGAFGGRGPWVLDRDSIAWRRAADDARDRARGSVPGLIAARRLPPGRRAGVVAGRLALATVPWLVRRRRGKPATTAQLYRSLRLAAEALGPTFIKLGQIISSGEGLFPAELVDEFKRCRDRVPPEEFADVMTIVEHDLGTSVESVFEQFATEPIASASIAQVHAARLRTGEDVVVKVQRPDVDRLVREDLRAMAWVAPHLIGRIPVTALANPPALVELFADTIVEELDFRIEAANMLDIAAMLHDLGQTGYVVPRPHPSLVTRRVLVMERLHGFKFDDVAGMRAAGVDTEGVVRTAMVALMEGAMIAGIFHGDLHGGNLLVLPDGRTGLLDYGIVGRLGDERRQAFLRLMVGATTNDLEGQMAALRDLGALPADADLRAAIRDLGLDQPMIDPTTLTGEEILDEVQRMVKALLGYGASMPKELMLYVKNMVFLDGAIATLAPDLDILAEITNIAMLFASRHGEQLGRDLGFDPRAVPIDLAGVKQGFGVDPSTTRLTHRDLQARRALIQQRMRRRG